jgi:hypothetical protein
MDRSMKVMFGMMTVAICLMALSMTGNQSQQAYAGEYVGGDRGTEPTIVWFDVSMLGNYVFVYHRLWSDGTMQLRYVRRDGNNNDCILEEEHCAGWVDVPQPTGGDGVACGADVNNDMEVNVTDLLAVMESWGSNVVCEPTYDCIDLNNLPSGMGG